VTIDERLERLAERHEALTQSLELLHLDTQENTKNIATLSLVIREVSGAVASTAKTVSQMSESISLLGRIA
jgi:hypothetical protein